MYRHVPHQIASAPRPTALRLHLFETRRQAQRGRCHSWRREYLKLDLAANLTSAVRCYKCEEWWCRLGGRKAQGPPTSQLLRSEGIPTSTKPHYALASNIRYASSTCEDSCKFLHVHVQETLSSCDFCILRQLPNNRSSSYRGIPARPFNTGQWLSHINSGLSSLNRRHPSRTVIVFGRSHSCTMPLAVAPRPRAHATSSERSYNPLVD